MILFNNSTTMNNLQLQAVSNETIVSGGTGRQEQTERKEQALNAYFLDAVNFVRQEAIKTIATSDNAEIISLIHPITQYREIYNNTLINN